MLLVVGAEDVVRQRVLTHLVERDYLSGDGLTLADFAVSVWLGYTPGLGLPTRRPSSATSVGGAMGSPPYPPGRR